jgi:ATP-binding cassette, subfamily B, bacterial CvaB/MchF/RaxB
VGAADPSGSAVPRRQFWLRRKLAVLLQGEVGECGLACLAMVASYWGHRVSVPELRRLHPASLRGMTLAQLMDAAASLGLQTRALRLEPEQLRDLRLPCLLHWNMNHFVVLACVRRHFVLIHDPASGQRRISPAELSGAFTGVALELLPGSDFKPSRPQSPIRLRNLMGQFPGIWRGLLQLLALGAALQVCAVAAPFYLQWVVDEALVTADRELLTILGMGFLLLALLQAVMAAVRSWATTAFATQLNFHWQGSAFAHLLKLPLSFFECRHLGDIASRFGSIQALQRSLTSQLIEGVIDGMLALVTLAAMFLYDARLGAIVACVTALYCGARVAFYRPLREASATQLELSARQQSLLLESVRGVQSLRVFGRTAERTAAWLNGLADQFNAELRIARWGLGAQIAGSGLFGVERIVVIWLAALAVLDQRFSVGMLFAFMSYRDQFVQRLVSLGDKLADLRLMRLHAARVADIALAETETDDPHTPISVAGLPATLELRDVWFRYGGQEPPILRGISLTIRAGECTAITGASGSGKTTLVKLLLGLYQPTKGQILIGGMPVSQLGLARYRCLVGAVMQDDTLFAGTVGDNICCFDPEPDWQRVRDCAQLAEIDAQLIATPMGYDSVISDQGAGLSGGQRQRLQLARALYKRPRILVLDEATSHLDLACEQAINAAIRRLPLTRVIVAHRPDTIAMADRVLLLSEGRIVSDSDPVDEDEQAEPHHVDEVPIPGHRFEPEMAGGCEVTLHAAQPDDGQHDGADRHVQTMKAGQHEERRAVDASA